MMKSLFHDSSKGKDGSDVGKEDKDNYGQGLGDTASEEVRELGSEERSFSSAIV